MAGHETLTWQDKVLLFFIVLLIVILLLLVLLFFCRQRLARWFPCLVFKIKPEEKTGWHHLDRFGEIKLKWASYNIAELRGRYADSVEEGSVQTNISLQVPVFEEKLNSTVTKKSVHMATADHTPEDEPETPKKKKKKQGKNRNKVDFDKDVDLKDSPVHHYYNEESV